MSVPIRVDPGRQALQHLEDVLAARPEKDGHRLSATLRSLSAFRDGLLALPRQRPDDPGADILSGLNAVISIVLAMQYPLDEVRWDEVGEARDQLCAIVEQVSEGNAGG